jgi:PAS domain S-box-containing protein
MGINYPGKSSWLRLGLMERLMVSIGLIMLITTSVLAVVLITGSADDYRRRHTEQARSILEFMSPVIAERAARGDQAGIRQFLETQLSKTDEFTSLNWIGMRGASVPLKRVATTAMAPQWFMYFVNLPQHRETIEVATGATHLGTLEAVTNPVPAINNLWEYLLKGIVGVFQVMLLMIVAVGAVLRTNLIGLRHLAEAADRFGEGRFDTRLSSNGAPELRKVFSAFNNMAQQVSGLLRDLSQSRRDLRDQLHFNMELLESLPIPVFYKDDAGLYLGVNRAWEEYIGISKADIVGKPVDDVFPDYPALAALHKERDQALFETPGSQVYEVEVPGPSGEARFAIYSKATFTSADGSIAGLIGTITDISELREAEMLVRSALMEKSQAEGASEAKTTFLANMSHEIRTPLTAIVGFAESLMDSRQGMDERLESIRTIIRSSHHLLNIINDILDISKIEASRLEVERIPMSPLTLVQEIDSLVRPQAEEKGLSFGIDYRFPIPAMLQSDPLRLRQILLNLCSNAVKFTASGAVRVELYAEPDDRSLCIDVVDSGIGMTEAEMQRVFEPFTQADATTTRRFGGTGLGLTLSRQLAELLGGSLNVESAVGKGSRFKLRVDIGPADDLVWLQSLPVPGHEAPEVRDARQQIPVLEGDILLAEDNADIRRLVGMYIRRTGAQLTVAENGHDAVLRAHEHNFDLVLMDMHMPVMSGVEALQTLRQDGYTNPIVVLTANALKSERDRCLEMGFDEFMSKPVDAGQFYALLSRYLRPAHRAAGGDSPLASTLLEEEPELADIVERFVAGLGESVAHIRAAYDSGDAVQLKDLVHQLKGVGGGMGYPDLTTLAGQIEFQIVSGRQIEIGHLLGELETMVGRITAGLHMGSGAH